LLKTAGLCDAKLRFHKLCAVFNLHLLNGGIFFPPDHFYRDISGTAKDEDMSFRDFSWIWRGFKTPYLLEP